MRKFKNIVALILLVLLAIVAIQNATTIQLDFLIWNIRISRIVLILVCVLGGGFIGWVMAKTSRSS